MDLFEGTNTAVHTPSSVRTRWVMHKKKEKKKKREKKMTESIDFYNFSMYNFVTCNEVTETKHGKHRRELFIH